MPFHPKNLNSIFLVLSDENNQVWFFIITSSKSISAVSLNHVTATQELLKPVQSHNSNHT